MPQIPPALLNSLSALPGFDAQAFVASHEAENRITSLRLNPFRKVELDFPLGDPVPWCNSGFYLKERPSFTLDPLFHAGCYYVQEAGSMFIELALKHTLDLSQPLRLLDLCAAPGGKSTLINSLISTDSLLVSNEFVKSRAGILAQNLSRWGTNNTVVTNNDPERFSSLPGFFDAIVVDAPCSGSGLFRKQPDAIGEWSESSVRACALRQQKILEDAIPALKEGGVLIYSTCSYSPEEDENIVKWLLDLGFDYIPLPVKNEWGIVETPLGYRFYPHLTKSEGFFCAALRKAVSAGRSNPKKKLLAAPSKQELTALSAFLTQSEETRIAKVNDQFHLLNPAAGAFLEAFDKQFYFRKAGTVIGELKGKDMVPNAELAWSLSLEPDVNRSDLSLENALSFLRKEVFQPSGSTNGLVLFTYKKQGLGWAKILPNRMNNYLPNELRILK